jgi:hypothetical protein
MEPARTERVDNQAGDKAPAAKVARRPHPREEALDAVAAEPARVKAGEAADVDRDKAAALAVDAARNQ